MPAVLTSDIRPFSRRSIGTETRIFYQLDADLVRPLDKGVLDLRRRNGLYFITDTYSILAELFNHVREVVDAEANMVYCPPLCRSQRLTVLPLVRIRLL